MKKYIYEAVGELTGWNNIITIRGVLEHEETAVASIEELVRLDIFQRLTTPCTFLRIDIHEVVRPEFVYDSAAAIFDFVKEWQWESILRHT